jgi:hypothetical protein
MAMHITATFYYLLVEACPELLLLVVKVVARVWLAAEL